ncbi:hypothetical protein NA56DRAFT_171523 [Hyaloscypha hepaticicola]|uniref:Uncharacterized protein n=1 Tax=Hyaloscypha hepaticicola TaxID=2082293 RepID=A0A2J6Q317_9HELO|nr:hypothetical protein NA56DRAFT_171523 [Hyaloscypha hepaticicola]
MTKVLSHLSRQNQASSSRHLMQRSQRKPATTVYICFKLAPCPIPACIILVLFTALTYLFPPPSHMIEKIVTNTLLESSLKQTLVCASPNSHDSLLQGGVAGLSVAARPKFEHLSHQTLRSIFQKFTAEEKKSPLLS